MPDVWSTFNELEAPVQERLVDVLETRGAEPQQRSMRRAFLDSIRLPDRARVLDVGCGTGVLTRRLARRPEVAAVVGADIAPVLLERARTLAAGLENVTYVEADAGSLPFDDEAFDAVVFDSTLSHVPDPMPAIDEACRVLRPGGRLAIFDGDYSTTTVALGEHDPLQACADAMMAASVTDRWLVRRLPGLVRAGGLEVESVTSYGFVETAPADYMLTVVDRGADLLRSVGSLDGAAAAALKAEARRRIEEGSFFGQIAYAGVVASKRPDIPHGG